MCGGQKIKFLKHRKQYTHTLHLCTHKLVNALQHNRAVSASSPLGWSDGSKPAQILGTPSHLLFENTQGDPGSPSETPFKRLTSLSIVRCPTIPDSPEPSSRGEGGGGSAGILLSREAEYFGFGGSGSRSVGNGTPVTEQGSGQDDESSESTGKVMHVPSIYARLV